ncbi:MAG: Uncharacterised protein [Cyanobium sp. ARS6]|nr:MAG: Uncharacterised protein [Cyanobium sp. ARS6]
MTDGALSSLIDATAQIEIATAESDPHCPPTARFATGFLSTCHQENTRLCALRLTQRTFTVHVDAFAASLIHGVVRKRANCRMTVQKLLFSIQQLLQKTLNSLSLLNWTMKFWFRGSGEWGKTGNIVRITETTGLMCTHQRFFKT